MLYTIYYMLYITYYKLYTRLYILYTMYYTLYTIRYTLYQNDPIVFIPPVWFMCVHVPSAALLVACIIHVHMFHIIHLHTAYFIFHKTKFEDHSFEHHSSISHIKYHYIPLLLHIPWRVSYIPNTIYYILMLPCTNTKTNTIYCY